MARFNNNPTPAQINLATSLGITLTPGMTHGELSQMIDATPPSEGQLAMAKSLDVAVTPGMTRGQLKPLLTQANIKVGLTALRRNPALKEGKYIALDGEVYKITGVWRNPRRPSVSLQPAGGGAKKVVSASLLRDVSEVAYTPPAPKRPRKKS